MTAIFAQGDIVHHVRTGNEYVITMVPPQLRLESTNETAYAYKGSDDTIWIRAQSQMEDGRFVLVKAAKENENVAIQRDQADESANSLHHQSHPGQS